MMLLNNTGAILLNSIYYFTLLNTTNFLEEDNIPRSKGPTETSVCYGIYGCFNNTYPWVSLLRPLSYLPESPEKIQPRFGLHTRNNRNKPILFDLLDFDMISTSGMDVLLPTYVIAHGFLEGGDRPWIKEMTLALLEHQDCNVVVVDWGGGSSPPYTQAVANIRLVGAMTAHLLAEMAAEMDAPNLDHVHIIGHSLGAHLAGYAGYTLQRDFSITVGRISGLDPAEPHFAKTKAPVRLDKTAAKYVDIIHTDANMFIRGGLGIIEPIGHVDYYPNGGNNQPGCDEGMSYFIDDQGGSFLNGIRKSLGCNHVRSYEYFTESIIPRHHVLAIACPTYEEFKNGRCFTCDSAKGQHCMKFGYHGKKSYDSLVHKGIISKGGSVLLYLMTDSKKPFLRGHYRVSADISAKPESIEHGGEIGQLQFTVNTLPNGKGPNSGSTNLKYGYYQPGENYQEMVVATSLPRMQSVLVNWHFQSNMFNPLTWRLTEKPRIFLQSARIDCLETQHSIKVCPKDGSPVLAGTPQLMLPSYC